MQEDRLAENGDVDATIQYEDFRTLENHEAALPGEGRRRRCRLLRPFKISLEDGRGQGSVQLTFHEIMPNLIMKAHEGLGHIS